MTIHRPLLLAIAMFAAAPAAHAQDFPTRKPGLWVINMSSPGGKVPARDMRICIDKATDAQMFKMGTQTVQGMCSKNDHSRSGNVVTTDAVCKFGTSTMSSHGVITFSGDTAYHTDITSKFEPPMGGNAGSVMTQDAKWSGACPSDMKPGDIDMGNGMKMNMLNMPGAKP